MNIKAIRHNIEYLSLILVLSFFVIHNIYLVFMGISICIYLDNKNNVDNLFILLKSKYQIEKKSQINSQADSNNDTNEKNNEIPSLSLVETIEILGFIPSNQKNNDSNAV